MIDAISTTAACSVDLKDGSVYGGVGEFRLSEEGRRRVEANRDELEQVLMASGLAPVSHLWIVHCNMMDGSRCFPLAVLEARNGTFNEEVHNWWLGMLNSAGRHPGLHVIGWSSDGDKYITSRHLREMAAHIRNTDPSMLVGPLRDLLPHVRELGIARYVTDGRHCIKCGRYRLLKGLIYAVPCIDCPPIDAEMLLTIGMTRAGISDRKQFKQDDLKVELFYDVEYLEVCAVMWLEQHELAIGGDANALQVRNRLGCLYVALAPYYCLLNGLIRNGLSQVDRHLLLSWVFVFTWLWGAEKDSYIQLMAGSRERLQYEKLTYEQRAENPDRGVMLFDRDALEKVLTTSLAYAHELFPDYVKHLGGLGTIRQEHAHAWMRGDVHGDHRSSTIQHAVLLRMANDMTQAEPCVGRPGRHRSRRGEAILDVASPDGLVSHASWNRPFHW